MGKAWLSTEEMERFGPNACGLLTITATTTAARVSATHLYVYDVTIVCDSTNTGSIAFGPSTVDAGASAQNAPRYAAGLGPSTFRFNDLYNLYAVASATTQKAYVYYTYYDASLPRQAPQGAPSATI